MALLANSPLDDLLADLDDGRLVHVERFPARAPRYGELERPLPAAVWDRCDLPALYTHQAQAIDLARRGESVAVATGTASGKSLCYQLPIAAAVADPVRPGSALCIFPTKALAQDQLRSLNSFDFPGLVAATYDGDASPRERTFARANANTILTNPEMLHAAVLPHHAKWGDFLMRLQYIVIDELHVLRGIFGTHMAHVLRRLRRLCLRYGADPTFVFSSATIGDPGRLAAQLCGKPVHSVTDDGSPRGPRTFVLLNPPVVDAETGARTSANAETASVAAQLIGAGHRTIAFCRSRKGTELVAADITRRLPDHLADTVRPYRSGYLTAERRSIEAELFAGTLRGVVATSALELGVDIGGLDACVLNGFPGTIASMWQQAGRVGRSATAESVAILVAGDDQLDQWLMANPEEVFSRAPEPAVINPSNPFIYEPHLACAAFETPLTHADERWWNDDLADGVRTLVVADKLKLRPTRRRTEPQAVWAARGYPSRSIGLRTGTSGEFRIALEDGTLIGTVDQSRAFDMVHPGAVYLHRGRSYEVVDLDLADRAAIVTDADGTTFTQARSSADLQVLSVDDHRDLGRCQLYLGSVEVSSQVTGYQSKDARSRKILGNHTLDLPPTALMTRAFWYVVDPAALVEARVDPPDVPGTLHAAEHTGIGILPLFTICDRWDVGGLSIAHHPDTGGPSIFIHDAYPGGAGVAELGFAAADRHLAATLAVIEACPCATGCPSCVQSPKCGNGNDPLDKEGAARLLRVLLEQPFSIDVRAS